MKVKTKEEWDMESKKEGCPAQDSVKGKSQENNGAVDSDISWPSQIRPSEQNLWEEGLPAKLEWKHYMMHLRIWKIIPTDPW